MRIGIYIGNFRPDSGGGFTFQDEVLAAFGDAAGASPHEFVVLGSGDGLEAYVTARTKSGQMAFEAVQASAFDRYRQTVGMYSPLTRRLFREPGPVERTARKLRLDCIWYVGGGVYEATDTPYVATVWDLQHRMTPWFPEMTAGGTWDARELSHRYFLQRASYVISGTAVGRDEITLCYGVSVERIRLLRHPTPGFALQAEHHPTGVRDRLGISEGYLIYPAQFWPHKNHVNLLYALNRLASRYGLRLPLVLVGSDKGNKQHVEKAVADLGLASQVVFAGYVTQMELADLYRHASMLVYASLCGPENLPPLEAFGLGCPVVAAEVPGAREQLQDAALLFNPLVPDSIADRIHEVHTTESVRRDLQQKGLARARAWTARDFAQGILGLFDDFSAVRRCWPGSDR